MHGDVVHDSSGYAPPIDLKISNTRRVRWHRDGLEVHSSVTLKNQQSTGRLEQSLRESQQITVEIWLTPANTTQKGPARIVTLSSNPTLRNWMIGQQGTEYEARLRCASTNENGIPSLITTGAKAASKLQHLVYTRSRDGQSRIYIDGQVVAENQTAGDFANWDSSYPLVVANENSGDRPWLGRLHRIAIFSTALEGEQIEEKYRAGLGVWEKVAKKLPASDVRQVDYVQDVKPILQQHCYACHADGQSEGGFQLVPRARFLEGGLHGRAVHLGSSLTSPLVHWITELDSEKVMPPKDHGDKMTDGEVAILRAWIDQGCSWSSDEETLDPRMEKAREHWAYQPLKSVEVPNSMADDRWSKTPVDRFIMQGLKQNSLTPSEPAAPRTWLRRIYLDVTGLPPTIQEAMEFEQQFTLDEDAARQQVIERLMSSDRYGERWGRHWLDLARYADSDGQEGDIDRPEAYRYRDFVIRALNDDMPFDQFVRWQIAGDELQPNDLNALAATGFLVAGPCTVLEDKFLEEERLQNRYNELDDMLSTIGTSFLGLTVGCARCHDHKYDAISSREYYRLLAALHSGDRKVVERPEGKVLAFQDFSQQPRTTWLFARGDFMDKRQEVGLGFPEILLRKSTADQYWQVRRQESGELQSTGQRAAMARWMTDLEHGAGALVARVYVNRIWQHYFGEGLVRTPSDFGVQGERPTHPELLEWLVEDFVANGWQAKRVHRWILSSAVYQQASKRHDEKAQIDPENRWLWRVPIKRIEAESLRDSMVQATGKMDLSMYGPADRPPIAEEAMAARNLKSPYTSKEIPAVDSYRRSVYLYHKRVIPYPLFQAFDRPDATQSCARRDNTIVAPQALAILNDQTVRMYARDVALRIFGETGVSKELDENADVSEESFGMLVDQAMQIVLGRSPSLPERNTSVHFMKNQWENRKNREPNSALEDTLTDYCQSLFGLNEFVYVD